MPIDAVAKPMIGQSVFIGGVSCFSKGSISQSSFYERKNNQPYVIYLTTRLKLFCILEINEKVNVKTLQSQSHSNLKNPSINMFFPVNHSVNKASRGVTVFHQQARCSSFGLLAFKSDTGE